MACIKVDDQCPVNKKNIKGKKIDKFHAFLLQFRAAAIQLDCCHISMCSSILKASQSKSSKQIRLVQLHEVLRGITNGKIQL